MNEGYLQVSVYADDISQPIESANIKVIGLSTIYQTDENGKTIKIPLTTVPKENSLSPNQENPYKTYDIEVTKLGMTTVIVRNIEIFPSITARQEVIMNASDDLSENQIELLVPPITLSGDYSPKYNDKESTTSSIVLEEVIVPEYVIVHDGTPDSSKVPNYIVTFPDYIKNVASSEIYPTWPKETLKANILAIMSFTLNRIYTEWYPSKGYNFTITSVTAYDQKYTIGKTIYDSISDTVDELMLQYIKRTNKEEPLLAQYCDGDKLQNEGWLWQWGSNDLGLEGKTSEEILKFYYGDSITIETAKYQTGLPSSFPGYELSLGSCGEEVKKFQNEINIIRGNYPGLFQVENPNGQFDEQTKQAVEKFQTTFYLNKTGIVDYNTWYSISYLYLAVERMIFGVYDR